MFKKKQDNFYFDNFVACADSAVQAASMLREVFEHFDPQLIDQQLQDIHAIEHKADQQRHELLNALVKAFITPIEREDIMLLSQCLDEVVDKMEDVVLRLYCDNIRSIKPEMIAVVDVLERCCSEMHAMIKEFSNFRHSRTLRDKIIAINTLEEEADALFIHNMRVLHTEETDPIAIIVWRDVYRYIEQCADACEHVADACEKIMMSNT